MKKGFTLIELLVVIVILSILATIAFLSFSSYSSSSRDTKRYSDFINLKKQIIISDLKNENLSNSWFSYIKFNELFNYKNELICYWYWNEVPWSYLCNYSKSKLNYLFTLLENPLYSEESNFRTKFINGADYDYRNAFNLKLKLNTFIGTWSFLVNFNQYLDVNISKNRVYLKKLDDSNKYNLIKWLLVWEKINDIRECYIMWFKNDEKWDYIFTNSNDCNNTILRLVQFEITFSNKKYENHFNDFHWWNIYFDFNKTEYDNINNKKTVEFQKQKENENKNFRLVILSLIISSMGIPFILFLLFGFEVSIELVNKNKIKCKIIGMLLIAIIIFTSLWAFL